METKMSSEPAPTVTDAAPRSSHVQSVDRAMVLLRAIADTPASECTGALLAERTGLNRATAWRILSTLETHGMVASDRATGQWSIGPGVIEVASSAGLRAVIRSARQVLERLSLVTGETASLAALGAGGLSYVDEVTPTSAAGPAAGWVGREVPLHATSTGKALLAFSDPIAVESALGPPLRRYTANTITDPALLRTDLARVRERGYAECHGEFQAEAWGVSAVVLDGRRPIAVLSVWGPNERVSQARFAALGTLTKDSAEALSRR